MPTTFVLVHAACHGGWSWRPVAECLRTGGHTVYAPTLPGLNPEDRRADIHLSDAVDYLVDYVESHQLTDIALVGHSWGGFVISGAGVRLAARISRLVYWSAFVPASGESMIDLCPPAYGELFRASAAASDDNSVIFPFEIFASALMQDATAETQRIIYPLLERQPLHTMTESLELEQLQQLQLPSSYVISKDDIALPAGEFGWIPRFPDRLHGAPVIYTPGSHEAQLTQAPALAGALTRAATL
ncbi:salicylate esterase [Mycobacterium saskatchewanense]|uniref:Esterase n=1 Tax=Mycobacterium saskatchewanense TaxID=220927 RepID=A0AAJ3NSB7_9MYCO|nr:alpha/beta fold hydrolase [Mycobacterium saskatchewanense]ORW72940.1 esterase [Mycobacterium saskatchewanense]BBX62527.1 salicylate esterase [Mycobacterium saskatchewanense]